MLGVDLRRMLYRSLQYAQMALCAKKRRFRAQTEGAPNLVWEIRGREIEAARASDASAGRRGGASGCGGTSSEGREMGKRET